MSAYQWFCCVVVTTAAAAAAAERPFNNKRLYKKMNSFNGYIWRAMCSDEMASTYCSLTEHDIVHHLARQSIKP